MTVSRRVRAAVVRAGTPAVALLTLAAACGGSAERQGADLVVYGRVWTADSARPWAQAVAIVGDTIAAVGDSAAVRPLVGSNTRVIDNGRGLVAPGFMDAHAHFLSAGFGLASVDLRSAQTPEEFVARVKAHVARLQPGEWVLGGSWDHENWPGTPLPTRQWIDSVTPNNPVFIDRLDGHMALANSAALAAAKVSRETRDVPGGEIVRDASGAPTGILKDAAMGLIGGAVPAPSQGQIDSAFARASAWAAERGVTAIASVSGANVYDEVATARRARDRGALTLRLSLYGALGDWKAVADSARAIGGDDWVKLNGVKGYVDGSLGSRTALFFAPYRDDPKTSGLLVTPEDSLARWIGAADSAGLQVVVHAIGERANALLLDIYDSVAKAHGERDRRFRIEHTQHIRPQDIERMVRSGVIASMQPFHILDDGRWAAKRIGPEQLRTTYAFRDILDRGGRLAFGSDWPVAPVDPTLGIYAAVTRRTLDGKNPEGWVPEQRIGVEEALRAYTAANAYGVFAERTRGMLRPGLQADVVALDRDIFTVPAPSLDSARVRYTIAGGRVVFERK